MEYINPKSFIHDLPDIPIVDVRSPNEYNKGHITGAINIPIFLDDERSKIGTIYKQKGICWSKDEGNCQESTICFPKWTTETILLERRNEK